MTKQLLSINEAAAHLGVSPKTLRRWEEKGILTPHRTIGNQRRYTLSDIAKLKLRNNPFPLDPTVVQPTPNFIPFEKLPQTPVEKPASYQNASTTKTTSARSALPWRTALFSLGGIFIVTVLTAITLAGTNLDGSKSNLQKVLAFLPILNASKDIKKTQEQEVLQAATQKRDFRLRVSVPAEFLKTASVAGNLTAPNILYNITAGDNITISGDRQNPTISANTGGVTSLGGATGDLALLAGTGIGIGADGLTITNDDPGSAQNIFGKIKVGSDTLSAGSNNDTFELAAGSGISLSTDTSNKKITIGSTNSSGIITVKEGDSILTSGASIIDFLGGDFDVTESPPGEANVALAATLTSVTGVAGSFGIGASLGLNGDTISDLTGDGLAVSSGSLGINLTTSGTTGLTTSNSGLEVSGSGLTLLKGCADNEILKYTDAGGWACSADAGGGSAVGGIGAQNQIAFWTNASTIAGNNNFYWDNTNERFAIGTNGTTAGKITVNGSATGKALAILNETGDQDLLTASASGVTQLRIDRIGNVAIEGAISNLSGGVLTVNDDLKVAGNDIIDAADTTRITLGGTTTITASNLTLSGTTTLDGISLTTINGGATAINFNEFDVNAATGSITIDDDGNTGNITIDGTRLDMDSLDFAAAGALTTTGSNDLTFTVGGGNVLFTSGTTLNVGGAAASAFNFFADSVVGADGTLIASDNDLYVEGGLEVDGQTRFGNSTYTWPASIGGNNYLLQTQTDGTLGWIDSTTLGTNFWDRANGALSPKIAGVYDLLLGSQSTASAKFAFTNVSGGTPTASISAQSTNNALSLDANGTITTTNKQTLTLGGPTTGNIVIGNSGFTSCSALESVNGVITCGTDDVGSAGTNYWQMANGAIAPFSETLDVLVGATATNAAEFAITGIAAGTPTASLSATTNGNGLSLTASNGTIQSLNRGTLTLGGNTTGNIVFAGFGTGVLHADANGVLSSSDVVLGTETGGNYVATITGNSQISVTGSGGETAGVTLAIAADSIGDAQLAFNTGQNLTTSSTPTFSGLTLSSLTLGSDTVNDLTGTGLQMNGNSLETTLGTSVDLASEITGVLPLANGGTGQNITGTSITDGQLLIGNNGTDGFSLATLTAGTGISITNGAGSITIAQTGGSSSKWTQSNSLGILYPNLSTLDLLVGGTATNSSKFAVINVAGGNPTASISAITSANALSLDATGTIGTTNKQTLTLGGASTGNIILANPVFASGGLTVPNGQTTRLASFTNDGGVIYANSSGVLTQTAAGSASQCLIGGSTPSWTDCGGAAGDDWNFVSGALSPKFASVTDLLLGSTATASAKFAFSNVTGGTPTASISAQATNNALSIDAGGNIFTTNKQSLTLGSTSTGNIVLGNTGFASCSALETIGGVLTCGTDDMGSAGTNYWQIGNGAISPFSETLDVLVGATATSAAEFAITGIAAGTPTASISATTNGNGLSLTGSSSTLQSLNNATLTIGGNTTGNIVLAGRGGVNNSIYLQGYDCTGFANGGTLTVSATGLIQCAADDSSAGAGTLAIQENGSTIVSGATAINFSGKDFNVYDLGSNAGKIELDWNSTQIVGGQYSFLSDILAGGTSTASAKFAVLNMQGAGIPTASIAAQTTNNALSLDATGTIGTTNKQTLTLGTASTGDLNLVVNTGNNLRINGAIGQTVASASCVTTTNGIVTGTSTCPSSAANFIWNTGNGTIFEGNTTQDLLIGGISTASAKFAILNVNPNSGTPTASVSGTTGSASLTATGILATTAKQTLTLGDSNTGNIVVANPAIFATSIALNNDTITDFTGTGLQMTGTTLTTTLGTSVDLASEVNGILPMANGGSPFEQANGAIIERLTTQDLLLGSTATASSKFAFTNVAGGTPTASISAQSTGSALSFDATGTIGTTNKQTLSLGTSSTGDLNLVVNTGNNLRINGAIGQTVGTASCVTTTNGIVTGTSNCPSVSANNIWNTGNGTIYQGNTTQDLLIGGVSTASAKFAVLNVNPNSGTPTASVSGTTGAIYLTADGSLGTTNNQTLAIGTTTTGNIGLGTDATQRTITIGNTTSGTGVNIDSGTGGINLGDNSTIKTIDIGGNNNSGTDTIRIATEGTAADTITIGNNNAATTLALVGGDDWTITAAGVATFSQLNVDNLRLDANTFSTTTGDITIDANGDDIVSTDRLTLGSQTPTTLATLDVRALSGTLSVATVSGQTSFASLVVDNAGAGDIFTASASGRSRLTVTNSGDLRLYDADASNYTGFKTPTNISANSVYELPSSFPSSNNYVLQSNTNGILSWVDPGSLPSVNFWDRANGTLSPKNAESNDLLLGSTATNAAEFAVTGISAGAPTATLSATTNGNGISLNASTGTIQSLNRATLTLGGATTGNIVIANPTIFSTSLALNNDTITDFTGTGLQMNGTSLETTLGTSVNLASAEVTGILPLANGGTNANLTAANGGIVYADSDSFEILAPTATAGLALVSGASSAPSWFTPTQGSIIFAGTNGALSQDNANFFFDDTNNKLGIGTTTPLTALDVRGLTAANGGTTAVASISGRTAYAGFLVDNSGAGDLFTASSSGLSRFVIKQNGNVGIGTSLPNQKLDIAGNATASGSLRLGGVLQVGAPEASTVAYNRLGYGVTSHGLDASNDLFITGRLEVDGSLFVDGDLIAGGSAGTVGWFQRRNNALAPTNITDDLLLGSISTASAKFAFTNVAGGTPTASISAQSTNNALTLDATGNIGTTNRQSLTLGGASTGDINLAINSGNNLRINGIIGATIGAATCVVTSNGIVTGTGSCDSPISSFIWSTNAGAIVAGNTTMDLLVGSVATSSAKFAILNVAGNNTPVASLSAGANGGAFLSANGTLQTTMNQSLTIGGGSTGNISLNPLGGTGTLALNAGNLTINGQQGATSATLTCVSVQNGIVTGAGGCGAGAGGSKWTVADATGVLYPQNPTVDLLIGGTTTASAKFAIINVAGNNTPVASISAGTAGAAFLSSNGTLQTTARQSLTLGGGATGNVVLSGAGTGIIHSTNGVLSSSAINLAGGATEITGILPVANGGSPFEQTATGAIVQRITTQDLLIGGTATNSSTTNYARAAFLNIAGALTPVASLSAGNAGGTFFSAAGAVQTTARQSLTLGGGNTGNIVLSGFTAGVVHTNASGVLSTSAVDLSSEVTNTLSVGNGGTGQTSFTSGSLLYGAGGATALNSLALGGANTCLLSNGTAPTWGSCSLGTNFWQSVNPGTITPANTTMDLLVGGVSSSSATFHLFGAANTQGTNPVASVSGNTSNAAFITDNRGNGDLFAASSSGLSRFTVKQNGDIQVGTFGNGGSPDLLLASAIGSSVTWAESAAGYVKARYDASNNFLTFEDEDAPILSILRNSNSVSIGSSTGSGTGALGTLYVSAASDTLAVASLSAKSNSFAAMVVDNRGTGDLLTASSSGQTRFVITQTGNLQFAGNTNTLNTLTSAATSAQTYTLPGTGGTLCVQNSSACGFASGTNFWQSVNPGTISPANSTVDLFIGGVATNSSKFTFTGVAGTSTPVASIAATPSSGTTNGLSFSGTGTIQSLNNNTLTIGGNTTGNISIEDKIVTSTGDLILDPADEVYFGDTKNLIIGGHPGNVNYNVMSNASNSNQGLDADNDLFIEDDLEIDGTLYADGGIDSNLTQNSVVFAGTNGVLSEDTANFVWDDTNNRHGIGVSTNLLGTLDVRGTADTLAVASVSGKSNSFAAMVVDNRGTGDILAASSSGLTRFVIKNNGNVGIGTNLPQYNLHIVSSVDPNALVLDSYGAVASNISGRRANGTVANPTATAINDNLLVVSGSGYGTTGFASTLGAASINFRASQAWTDSAQGTYLTFNTTPNNSITPSERVRIDNNGSVGIGTGGNSILATLDLRGVFDTLAVASVSGKSNSFAAMVVDSRGTGDLFTASASGLARFTIRNNGLIQLSTTPYGTCAALTTVAGLITCGSGASNWDVASGVITPKLSSTLDLLIGGTTSSSARFHAYGSDRSGTTPAASISANSNSFAGLVVNNRGTGDVFTASRGGKTLFTIGNDKVQIGTGGAAGAGGSEVPQYLALDTKGSPGDPGSGQEGYMYYNTVDDKFRCYQGGGWIDCISASVSEYLVAEDRTQATATSGPGSTSQVDVDDHIDYDTVVSSSGSSVSLDTSTGYTESAGASSGRFTLQAGKTYKLAGDVKIAGVAGNNVMEVRWYNVTAATGIGSAGGVVPATNATNASNISTTAEAVISPTVTTIVELRVTNDGTGNLNAIGFPGDSLYPNAFIEVIGGNAQYTTAAEYLRVELHTDQASPEVDTGDHVGFDTVAAFSGTSASLNTGSFPSLGRITLKPGKTYRLMGVVPWTQTTNYAFYQWYNVTSSAELGNATFLPTSSYANAAGGGPAEAIITPTVTTVVELRLGAHESGAISNIVASNGAYDSYPYAFIEVIGDGTQVAQFTGATSSTDGAIGYIPAPVAGQQGSLLLGNGTWTAANYFTVGTNLTMPIASLSARTSFAGLVVDNSGNGDIFAASSSGLNRFVINNNGNVGIGTTMPSAQLQIVNPNSGGTNSLSMYVGSSGAPRIDSGGGNLLINFNNGNSVALGGAAGSGGTDSSLQSYGIVDFRRNTDSATALRVFGSVNGGSQTLFNISSLLTGPTASIGAVTTGAGLVVDNRGSGDLFAASSSGLNRFVIKQNGNVGIGSTLPEELLHIQKNADAYLKIQATTGTGQIAGIKLQRGTTSDSLSDWNIYDQTGAFFIDSSDNLLGTRNRLYIDDQTGFMGVGTSSPLAMLDVRGASGTRPIASTSARTSFAGLVVDNSGAGDIFTASASGLARFTIQQNGNVGIGTANFTAASPPTTGLTIGNLDTIASTGTIKFVNVREISNNTNGQASYVGNWVNNGFWGIGAGTNSGTDFTVRIGSTDANSNTWSTSQSIRLIIGGAVGQSALAKLDVRAGTFNGTLPVASISGRTSGTTLILDNSNSGLVGDIITASSSGLTRFVIGQNGSAQIWLNGFAGANQGLCHNGTNGATGLVTLGDCNGAPSDYAEWYGTDDTSIDSGDVVSIDPEKDAEETIKDGVKGSKAWIVKTDKAYQASTLGIVSTEPNQIIGENFSPDENPRPVALNGRVPVKIASNSAAIKRGDMITASSVAGRAMKATQAGQVVGKALEDWTPESGKDKIFVFVNTSWYDPQVYLTSTGNVSVFEKGDAPDIEGSSLFGVRNESGEEVQRTAVFSDAVVGNLKTGSLDVQDLSLGGVNVNDRLLGLESGVASASSGFTAPLASLKSQVASLADRVASLEANIQLLSSQTSSPSDPFVASSAAELSLDKIDVNTATVMTLNVLDRALINDLSVTGKITSGLLAINGLEDDCVSSLSLENEPCATINTTGGPLKLQSDGRNGVDINNGALTIDTKGNVRSTGAVTAKKINIDTSDVAGASAGVGAIIAGEDSTIIETTAVTNKSLIYVTFTSDYSPAIRYFIKEKLNKNSFTVELDRPVAKNSSFNWWIVN